MPLNANIILQQERPNMAKAVEPVDPVRAQIQQMQLQKLQQEQQDEMVRRDVLAQGGGVRERTLAAIQQNPQAAYLLPELTKAFDDADAAAERVRKAKFDTEQAELGYFGHLAAQVQAANYDPGILALALEHADENGHDTQAIRQLVETKPDQVKSVVDGIMARAGIEPKAPKAEPQGFTLSPGQTRYSPTGEQIAAAPVAERPATSLNPTEASLALAAARGDKAAEAALRIMRGQRVGAGGGSGQKSSKDQEVDQLVDTVIENPALWDQLTPTVRGTIAPRLRAKGYTEFGKPLSDGAMKQISDSQSAIDSLKDLRAILEKNEAYLGPVAGLAALNPYSEARKAQADIDLVRQRVGKALEGGVLRKEDEEKYKKILATLRDTPETAIYKVDQLMKNLERDIENFKAAQRLGGKRAPASAPKDAGSVEKWERGTDGKLRKVTK